MKTRLVLFLLLFNLLFSIKICAQYFHAMPPGFNFQARELFADTTDGSIYAGGNFWMLADSTPMNSISRWDGTKWDSLGSGLYGFVSSIVKFNDTIYAGGAFSFIDSTGSIIPANIAKWTGSIWQLPLGGGANEAVANLRVYNSSLYVVGSFSVIGGIVANRIARFDGTTWHSYPSFITPSNSLGDCIFYNGELYVGGDFAAGLGKNDIAKFDGINWVTVGGGFSGGNSWVNTFNIFQSKLYVGGYFQVTGGDPGNNIAIWDGVNWSQPGNGVMPSNVDAMQEFNNELYVGGQINNASGLQVTFIAKWNGSQWHSLNANFDNAVGGMCTLGNSLYIIGGFIAIDNDTVNFVTRYTPLTSINLVTSNKEKFNISSNPNNGNFIINYSLPQNTPGTLQIFDVMGKQVYRQVLPQWSIMQRLSLATLPAGMYVAKVTSGECSSVVRFVME